MIGFIADGKTLSEVLDYQADRIADFFIITESVNEKLAYFNAVERETSNFYNNPSLLWAVLQIRVRKLVPDDVWYSVYPINIYR